MVHAVRVQQLCSYDKKPLKREQPCENNHQKRSGKGRPLAQVSDDSKTEIVTVVKVLIMTVMLMAVMRGLCAWY